MGYFSVRWRQFFRSTVVIVWPVPGSSEAMFSARVVDRCCSYGVRCSGCAAKSGAMLALHAVVAVAVTSEAAITDRRLLLLSPLPLPTTGRIFRVRNITPSPYRLPLSPHSSWPQTMAFPTEQCQANQHRWFVTADFQVR